MKDEKDKKWVECDHCKCLSQNIYEKGCDRCHHENGLPRYTKYGTPIRYHSSQVFAIIKARAERNARLALIRAQMRGTSAGDLW